MTIADEKPNENTSVSLDSLLSSKPRDQDISRILKDVVYSFTIRAVPIVVAFFVIPQLIAGLGDTRFGILSLGWVFLGYFTLFDLGLGRAITKFVSEYLARDAQEDIPVLIWTSWALISMLAILGGLVLFVSTPILVTDVLNLPQENINETRVVFYVMALSIPFVIFTTGVRAVLEAYQQFRTLAVITTPSSSLTYLIPYAALFFTQDLGIIVFLLLVNRVIFLVLYLRQCFEVAPGLRETKKLDWRLVPDLVRFGGWLTVTNIIGPLMSYLDRFLVGVVLTVNLVAYYVTPYEMLRRVQLLPTSLMTVLFPRFSSLHASDTNKSAQLFHRAVRLSSLVVIPIMLSIAVLSEDIIRLWINEEFAEKSAPVAQWLAIGIVVNHAGQVAYNWIQAAGRSDVTAKFHMLELPVFICLIWWLGQAFGIVGVAIAWTARVSLDTVLLFSFATRLLPSGQRHFSYLLALSLFGLAFMVGLSVTFSLTENLLIRLFLTLIVLALYSLVAWFAFLEPSERVEMFRVLKKKSWFHGI